MRLIAEIGSTMAGPNPPERRRASIAELGFALGRVEEILTAFRDDVGEWQKGVDRRLDDHGRRIRQLEEDKRVREVAERAVAQARQEAHEDAARERAELLGNEDRWGRWSPRAVVIQIAAGGSVGLLILLHQVGVI